MWYNIYGFPVEKREAMDINQSRTFTVNVTIPVRGFTAKGAYAIKELLLAKLPELAGQRQVDTFRIGRVWSDPRRTIYYRFGIAINIAFTANGTPEQLLLLKGDIAEYLAGTSIDYPKMERPDIWITWNDPDQRIRRVLELTLMTQAKGELAPIEVARIGELLTQAKP